MNPVLFVYFTSSESEEESNDMQIRRQLRDKSNPLSLRASAFKKRFRLSKEAFNYVLTEISFSGHLSIAVPPMLQLAATLSLLASGSFQHNVGNDYLVAMCQSSVCKIVENVVKEIEFKLCPKLINFSPEGYSKCMEAFMDKYKIPGVIGCIDGTHFGLQKPTHNEHMFFDRKGFHSLNSVIVCDYDYKILAICSKFGGAAHDSIVWKHSDQRNFLEQQYKSTKSKLETT